MKETKRTGFSFLRSYFDVLNELKDDKDKLSFLMAIINKQFLNEDPKDLDFIPNLCYESQRHAIEKSVKGWITAKNTDLKGNKLTPPKGNPKGSPKGSVKGDSQAPPKEEQEKEQVQEEVEYIYSIYPTKCPIKNSSTGKGEKNKKQIKTLLKTKSKEELENVIKSYLNDCKNSNTWIKNFKTFLNDLPDVIKEEQIIYWRKKTENVDLYHESTKSEFEQRFKTDKEKELINILPNKPMFGKLLKVG